MTDYAGQAPTRQYDDMPETPGAEKSIGEAIGDVTRDLSTLVQQELALAKAEVRQTATKRARQLECSPVPRLPRSCSCSSCRSPCGWQSVTGLGPAGGGHRRRDLAGSRRSALPGRPRPNEKISGIPQTAETVSQVPNALKGHEERNL